MRVAVAGLLFVVGACLTVYGVFLIYPPAAYVLAGLALASAGLLTDFDRGGKRATSRPPSRK